MEASERSVLTQGEPTGATDSEFRALFWKARLEHRRAATQSTPDAPAHQDALRFARAHGVKEAAPLLSALLKTYLGANKECLALLEPLEDETRLRGEIKFVEALAHHGLGDYDRAFHCYQSALASPGFSASRDVWRNIGILQIEKGEHSEALVSLHHALDQPGYEDEGFVRLQLGYLHSYQGDHAKALDCFQQASSSADCAVYVWPELGHLHLANGDYPSAITAYRNAINHPDTMNDGHLWACLGATFSSAGDFEPAIPALKRALELGSEIDMGETWHNLGRCYSDLSQHRDAIACFRRALNEPDYQHHALTWMTLADSYKAIGRADLEAICWRNCGATYEIEYPDEPLEESPPAESA